MERRKARCYRCGRQFEGSFIYGDIQIWLPGTPYRQQVEYTMCGECATAANELLEAWCSAGLPATEPAAR